MSDPTKISADPMDGASDTPDLGDDLPSASADDLGELATGDDDAPAAEKPAAGAADAGAGGSASVPHSRFNEVNEQKKRAEAERDQEREARIRAEERARLLEEQRIGAAKPAEAPAPAFDLAAKRKEYREAVLEGDDERANKIEDEIDEYQAGRTEARVRAGLKEDAARAEIQAAAESVVAEYPFLNSTVATCNKEALAEVIEFRDYYISKGKAPAAALTEAVKRLKPQLDALKEPGTQQVKPPAAPKPKTAEELAKEREAASRKKAAEAAAGQPASPTAAGGGGSDEPDPDPLSMSSDEWSKLPKSQRDRFLV